MEETLYFMIKLYGEALLKYQNAHASLTLVDIRPFQTGGRATLSPISPLFCSFTPDMTIEIFLCNFVAKTCLYCSSYNRHDKNMLVQVHQKPLWLFVFGWQGICSKRYFFFIVWSVHNNATIWIGKHAEWQNRQFGLWDSCHFGWLLQFFDWFKHGVQSLMSYLAVIIL